MYRESLLNNRDQVLLSKQLAAIQTNVPIEWDLESLRTRPVRKLRLLKRFTKSLSFQPSEGSSPEDDSRHAITGR